MALELYSGWCDDERCTATPPQLGRGNFTLFSATHNGKPLYIMNKYGLYMYYHTDKHWHVGNCLSSNGHFKTPTETETPLVQFWLTYDEREDQWIETDISVKVSGGDAATTAACCAAFGATADTKKAVAEAAEAAPRSFLRGPNVMPSYYPQYHVCMEACDDDYDDDDDDDDDFF